MRLLSCGSDGRLVVSHDLPARQCPRYAILSHTWSPNEDDEVTYRDILDGTAQSRIGFRKLEFTMNQARQDGFEYCWVDTCCINRLNEPELSQAIRSMFRWYRDAARCYVYMSDVPGNTSDRSIPRRVPTALQAFFESRWFDRGWTVQELLAPSDVIFFASDGSRIGDKEQLAQIISLRTRIPEQALQEQDIPSFSVEERLSWFETRETKREEDIVYAALGLFDVHLAILYGEGVEHARARLMRKLDGTQEGESTRRFRLRGNES